MELKVGQIWRAKKPKASGVFLPYYDDRQILYIGPLGVQYDSPTVRLGRRHPIVSMEKFLKWAGTNVTEGYPAGDWAPFERKSAA